MDRRRSAVLPVVALLTLVACNGDERTVAPSPSPTTSPAPTVAPRTAEAVVVSNRGDLWLYDVASDRMRRLTRDGESRRDLNPRFLGGDEVAYIAGSEGGDSIEAIPAAGGKARTIVSVEGSLLAFGASPDGTAIAYLTVDFEKGEPHTLWAYSLADERPKRLRRFPQHLGRGGTDDDEVSVTFSPDGTTILVTDTHLSPNEERKEETLFVLDLSGEDRLPPRLGTFGRWSPDGKTLYYRGYVEQDATWRALNVADGSESALGLRRSSGAGSLSPDGRSLAVSLGDPPALVVFDIPGRRESILDEGYIAPLWLSDTELAATAVRPCRPGAEECVLPGVPTEDVRRYARAGDRSEPLALTSTLDADVLYT